MADINSNTRQQVGAALQVIAAVADAIREVAEVPSGELYAQLMSQLTLAQYESIIRTLKGAGLITDAGHLIKWVGPPFAGRMEGMDAQPLRK